LLCEDHNNPSAQDAIRHIGTNALPFLVRWVAYEPPAWKNRLSKIATKLSKGVTGSPFFISLMSENSFAESRADGAVEAFYVLGKEAIPAVKQLTQIEANRRAPSAARRAWRAMALIGKSIPDSPEWVEERVHKLITDLAYPGVVERLTAINSLGQLGPRAREAVPWFFDMLNDSSYLVRETTTNALLKIAPEVLTQNGQTNFFRIAVNRSP
jgi:hypothetical protein